MGSKLVRHGMSYHPLYPTWWGIMLRCENPSDRAWPDYGGRGIRLWPAWHDPVVFIEYIEVNLGPRPWWATLDRIDNDDWYWPGNVRWATRRQQTLNTRRMTITMATFVQWLNDQAKRENDPVGWFARYWRDLDQRPRLSSPASIAKHLEDRGLFKADPHLRDAYDATLREYRHVREQTVAEVSGVQLPGAGDQQPLPGMPVAPAMPPPGITIASGQIQPAALVASATQAGLDGAQKAAERRTQLDRIERMLETLLGALGLAEGQSEIPWAQLFAVADLDAAVDE